MFALNHLRNVYKRNPRLFGRHQGIRLSNNPSVYAPIDDLLQMFVHPNPDCSVYHVSNLVENVIDAPLRTEEDLPRALPYRDTWLEFGGTEISVGFMLGDLDFHPGVTDYGYSIFKIECDGTRAGTKIVHYGHLIFTGRVGRLVSAHVNPLFQEDRTAGDYVFEGMLTVSMIVTLLHCKNVATSTYAPDESTVRRHRKAGNMPPVSYKTLKLTVPRTVKSNQPRDQGGGLPKNRAHDVDGHYKYLRAERYKAPGLYYWPKHRRGCEELGEVIKTYEVRPAQPPNAKPKDIHAHTLLALQSDPLTREANAPDAS